ncbi:MAG TPA: hypothetical protein VIY72_09390, partial [Acidimicrobiales bacterium]
LGGGALLAACGSESPGASKSGGDSPYLLPPEGADVTGANGSYGDPTSGWPDPEQVNGYFVTWNDPSGAGIQLNVARSGGSIQRTSTPSTVAFTPPSDVDQLIDVVSSVFGDRAFNYDTFERADIGPLDPAASYCLRVTEERTDLMVLGTVGDSLAVVSGGPPGEDGLRPTPPCDDLRRDSAVLQASRDLRVVDEAEWRAFMEEHGSLSAATTTTASTTTTLDPSLVAYCDAVARFTAAGVMDPDSGVVGPEGVPYLEDIRDVAPSELRASYDAYISWVAAGSPEPAPEGVGAAGLAMTRDYVGTCQGRLE